MGTAAILTSITGLLGLAYKIYKDYKSAQKTDEKINVLAKYTPQALEEIEEMDTAWKEYQAKKKALK